MIFYELLFMLIQLNAFQKTSIGFCINAYMFLQLHLYVFALSPIGLFMVFLICTP